MRIACVMGTVPEAVKMAPVVCELRRRMPGYEKECQVWWTGQHAYAQGLRMVMRHFHFQATTINQAAPGHQALDLTLPEGLACILTWLTEIGAQMAPELVIAAGDTTSVAAAALWAFYTHRPFAHVEAGLRTVGVMRPFPEEMHRRLADEIATWHFTPTQRAQCVFGRNPMDADMTGNTVIDAVDAMMTEHDIGLRTGDHIVVTCHRREASLIRMKIVFAAVAELCRRHTSLRVKLPIHPGLGRQAIAEHAFEGLGARVDLCPLLEYPQFLRMLAECRFVITDSGGIQEEACRLGKRCVVIRNETERDEAVSYLGNYLVGYDEHRILAAAESCYDKPESGISRDTFGDGHAAGRIADVLLRESN